MRVGSEFQSKRKCKCSDCGVRVFVLRAVRSTRHRRSEFLCSNRRKIIGQQPKKHNGEEHSSFRGGSKFARYLEFFVHLFSKFWGHLSRVCMCFYLLLRISGEWVVPNSRNKTWGRPNFTLFAPIKQQMTQLIKRDGNFVCLRFLFVCSWRFTSNTKTLMIHLCRN